jgi:cell filamentation protein
MSYVLYDGVCLKNKLGATDDRVLDTLAADYTTLRIGRLELGFGPRLTGSPPNFDLAYLKALHHFIFQDVFEWAGRTRDEHIALSDGTTAYVAEIRKLNKFTDSVDIRAEISTVFAELRASNNLVGLSHGAFCAQAASFLVRLNAIHPFREGNGRTQRAFMAALARHAGHEIAFDVMSKRMNMDASIASKVDDPAPMHKLLKQLMDPAFVTTLRAAYPAIATHHPDLADLEIRLLEPGQHVLVMLLPTTSHFVARTPDGKLVAGTRADLPTPEPQPGDAFEVSVTPKPSGSS